VRAQAHPGDKARLEALRAYGVLDTPREADFDDIVALAAQICGTPISVVSLVDADRQWFKAAVGLSISETPLNASICAHAILMEGLVEIPDTQLDARFVDNPLVQGDSGLRFYAGTVLETPDGFPLGTLCVLDTVPRHLTDDQKNALRVLGRQVMTQLELRRQSRELDDQRQQAERAQAASEEAAKFLTLVTDRLPVRVAYLDREYRYQFVNDAYERELGLRRTDVIGRTILEVAGEEPFALTKVGLDLALGGHPNTEDLDIPYPSGRRFVRISYEPDYDGSGVAVGVVCHVMDVTQQREAERALREARSWLDTLLKLASVGTWNYEPATGAVLGDPNLATIFGMDPGEASRASVATFLTRIHPEDRDKVAEAFGKTVREGTNYDIEYRILVDGQTRWVAARGFAEMDATGKVVSLPGVVIDVTVQRTALAHERSRLGELLDKAPAFTALLEGPEHTFMYVNEEYRKLIGHRHVIGLPIQEALPEISGQGYFEMLDRVLATGESIGGREVTVQLQRQPGSASEERYVDFLYQPMRDADGVVYGVFVHGVDITDQVFARKEVAERQELFRTVFEQAPDDAIVMLGLDRTILAWNPAAERVIGWKAEEALGQLADIFFSAEDRLANVPLMEVTRAARLGKAADERWHVRKDGSRFWGSGTMNSLHDMDGAVRGYLKVFRDATELHRQTAALSLHRRVSDAILEVRDPNQIVGTIERLMGEHFEANRVLYGEFAEDGDQFDVRVEWRDGVESLVGTHRVSDFGSRIAENMRNGHIDVIRDREKEFTEEDGLLALRAGGAASAVTVPARSEGRVVGVFAVNMIHPHNWTEAEIGLVQQIADRLVAEIERARAESALQDANHLLETRVSERTKQLEEAVREAEGFNYSIAHDFRSPLRAVAWTSNLLIEELGEALGEEHRELLQRQANNAVRLGRLIDELLRLSRLSRVDVNREPLNITRKAKEIFAHFVQDGQSNGCRLEAQPGMTAQGDPGLVRTVLDNLIGNACKFSPSGGVIRVSQDGKVFSVSDEGIGFDVNFAAKIFLPFERLVLDSEFEGTGIGLANVDRIVKRHHGRVWVESETGRGTTFFFTLEP